MPFIRPGRSVAPYSSNFSGTENPLSEGGVWASNATQWTRMRMQNGVAHGTNGPSDTFDDSYAYLQNWSGENYEIEGAVFRSASLNEAVAHEIELEFRVADSASAVRLYECLFNFQGGMQIFRWENSFGSFSADLFIADNGGSLGRQLQSGDVLKARIVGNNITMFINSTQYGHCDITTGSPANVWTTGKPGIGAFTRPGGNSEHLALTSVLVTAL